MKNRDVKRKPAVVDLFCGCGGLSFGFQEAGYNVLLGVDNEKQSLITFKANHSKSEIICADLSDKEAFGSITKSLSGKKVDVILAGPPCQGFSLTGPRKFDDPRNKLYLAVFTAVKKLKPKAFLIENVPGMATLYKGAIKDKIIARFNRLGYNVTYKIVCAADYGVPQLRKRLIFVGLKSNIGSFTFPKETHTKENYLTCSDAHGGDLPSRDAEIGLEIDEYKSAPKTEYQKRMRLKSNKLYNHVATQHKDFVVKVISQVPEGGNYKDLPPGVGSHRKFHVAWTRYHSAKPSSTIDTGHRNHFHYKFNRVPTVRENARLQSFPDSFKFYGTRTSQNKQIGNAVPPLLGYNIGKEILKSIG